MSTTYGCGFTVVTPQGSHVDLTECFDCGALLPHANKEIHSRFHGEVRRLQVRADARMVRETRK